MLSEYMAPWCLVWNLLKFWRKTCLAVKGGSPLIRNVCEILSCYVASHPGSFPVNCWRSPLEVPRVCCYAVLVVYQDHTVLAQPTGSWPMHGVSGEERLSPKWCHTSLRNRVAVCFGCGLVEMCRYFCWSRLKSGNACYHSVQNLLSSSLLSRNLKIKVHRTVILPVFCMGVKLGRSHWGRNVGWGCLRIGCWGEYLGLRGMRMLRRIFGPKRDEIAEENIWA